MDIKIFDTPTVQNFLKMVAGFDEESGNDRGKQIIHRILSDLYRTIEDYDITAEEYWAAVSLLNSLGQASQFGLLSPGLGFDHYLDMRMDAADAKAKRTGGTPRTIEGPLYVAGAPEAEGFARMDDDPDTDGEAMWLHGQVRDTAGQPIPNAKVEIWHCNSKGGYSFFDKSQTPYNLRRTIIADNEGYYRASSVIPSGYAVPDGAPTDQVLKLLGRHGERPAHIHYFISAPGYQHLTTQINLAGDPYTYDDFAFATREELVVEGKRVEHHPEAQQYGVEGVVTEVVFNIELSPTEKEVLQERHKRPRAMESGSQESHLAGAARV